MTDRDEVTQFLTGYPTLVQGISFALRNTIREIMPDAREMTDTSDRVIGYGFGSGYADLICTIIPSKKGVKLGIVRGSELPDPKSLMEGAGKRHRYVAFSAPADLQKAGVKPLLKEAVKAWKRRSEAGK